MIRLFIIAKSQEDHDALKKLLKNTYPELTIIENPQAIQEGIHADQKLCIPIISGFKVIDVEQIVYLEANSNYTTIYLRGGNRFIATKPLGALEERLSGKGFFRCHRTYLINLDFVDEFIAGQNASIVLKDESQLPLARNRREAFLRFFHL